jgi:hypothetical protein
VRQILTAVLLGLATPFAGYADPIRVTAHSATLAVEEISIQNMSLTEFANVTFTFSGQASADTSATGNASAAVSGSVRFDRVDVPEFLLSDSVSAPPSGTRILPPHSFTFDIAPSAYVILVSVESIATDLMVASAMASAMARGTGVDISPITRWWLVSWWQEVKLSNRATSCPSLVSIRRCLPPRPPSQFRGSLIS